MYRKMTVTPAGCVRSSQAGTKLDRTQTAVGLLRFVMKHRFKRTACTHARTKSFDAILMTTLLELVVFLAPPLRPDADLPCASRPVKPRAQLNPCNNSNPSTRRLETDLGRARQHIVHLQCLRGLFCKLVHIDAGLCGCNCWRTPTKLQRWRRKMQ